MNANKEIMQQLRDAFTKAIDSLMKEYKGSSLTDLFVVVDKDGGELSIFDDEEHCVFKGVISAWENEAYEYKDNDASYISVLQSVLAKMNDERLFEPLDIFKPFSINYSDEEMIVLDELLLINDDSLVRLDDEVMQKIDKEFDDFLAKLMKD